MQEVLTGLGTQDYHYMVTEVGTALYVGPGECLLTM